MECHKIQLCFCRLLHSGNRFRFGECVSHQPVLHTHDYGQ
jgi:hypothetical protein